MTGTPLRADARRNRERLLAAAEQVFTEQGVTASTEDVARAAGVGVGTVFRHFPTKEQLIEAVYQARLSRLADLADRLAASADPGAAFAEFFTTTVEGAATKNALAEALSRAGVATSTAEVGQWLRRALGVLLTRAQETGAVRPDVTLPDLMGLLIGTSRAVEHLSDDPGARTRVVRVVLDGLRVPG
ncbi:MAG: TetR/AcrR family transcriptional regulator [Hamadaea sp.]|uniref:TetR/AcrR family transcriptional regulator n=1 Tax=Hamadaea sp. TaxID=2024425 RepID=UPI00181B1FA5|nr:TetR/AcrR family transcriptional regulator [Hamadaea sp.]NUR70536.1 TetR/AcrR family transcriptional regulator [Hamadaea sp.]NUT18143.1 TetR/AcrR family transcriptional regulator [Hamadaea sp.]